MNCKPGDLALYKGMDKALAGKIVTCARLADPNMPMLRGKLPGAWWWIDPPLNQNGILRPLCADSSLIPIRDPGDDAVDETLQWLPAPITDSQIKEDKSQEVAHG